MKKYFIHNDSSALGPFTLDELKEMEITKYTPVWCEGLQTWTPAAHVKELDSLWSVDRPFIYHTAPPPIFNKDAYEKTVSNGIPAAQPHAEETGYGSKVFWIGLAALVIVVGSVLAYRYHSSTVDQTYMAALEQRKWEDSVNKQVDTARSASPMLDNATDNDSDALDLTYETERKENAKNYARMNIERFVRCAKSFEVKRLGGIQDARIVFYNNSDFPINRADFKVAYIKANGEVYTTHNVSISNIPAHGRKETAAPEEKRGTDMKCMLTKVTSTELGLAKNVQVVF